MEQIVEHVREHHEYKTSRTKVRRVLKEEGLERLVGGRRGGKAGEKRLKWGGMKLVEAAMEETGYLAALSAGIQAQVEQMAEVGEDKEVDRSDRDE